jgi:formate hydrogenlyase subunit 4
MPFQWILPFLGWILAPLLPGIINRVKAGFAGRQGPPLVQAYFDLMKLLRKGAVYSRTTSWVFPAGPILNLAAMLVVSFLIPLGGQAALLAFPGDLVLFCGLLGLARLATLLAALDTGSSFEGMGASREAWFGALAEPTLYFSLAAVCRYSGSQSMSQGLATLASRGWYDVDPELALASASLLVVFLVENCRIPVDDPNTHLELTMIHEVMVLDHGGPDLAFIQYASSLRLWILGSLLVGLLLPSFRPEPWLNLILGIAGQLLLAVCIGVIESVMARLRLTVVPQLLVGALTLAVTAALLGMI